MGTRTQVHHLAGFVVISMLGWAGILGTYFTSPEFKSPVQTRIEPKKE
jgi:hypothetical protein